MSLPPFAAEAALSNGPLVWTEAALQFFYLPVDEWQIKIVFFWCMKIEIPTLDQEC